MAEKPLLLFVFTLLQIVPDFSEPYILLEGKDHDLLDATVFTILLLSKEPS